MKNQVKNLQHSSAKNLIEGIQEENVQGGGQEIVEIVKEKA